MSDRSQQLLEDPSAFVTPSSEGRIRKGTPVIDKGKRKLDSVNSSSGVPQKRKRKVIERERDVVNIRPSSTINGKVSAFYH